jgi:hypothetical protein
VFLTTLLVGVSAIVVDEYPLSKNKEAGTQGWECAVTYAKLVEEYYKVGKDVARVEFGSEPVDTEK